MRLSVEEYSNTLNRSKISLGFCRDGNGLPILKQKVFEIMACGALLLDDWDTEAADLFKEGEDFIIFHSKQELLDLVRYYLSHDEERERIAKSGCQKVINLYNATNMWAYIFERIGFDLPDELRGSENYLAHREIMESIGRRNCGKD